jgi:hypothetical protein
MLSGSLTKHMHGYKSTPDTENAVVGDKANATRFVVNWVAQLVAHASVEATKVDASAGSVVANQMASAPRIRE